MSVQAETITVAQLFAEYVTHKRNVNGRKEKTIYDDLGLFKRHIQPVIGDKAFDAVTIKELHGLQIGLVGAKKYRSAELVTILLKSFYRYAAKLYKAEVRAGRLELPDLDDLDAIKRPPGAKRKVNELWTLEQVSAFLELAEGRYHTTSRSLVYPLFYTAITAGLRRGELLGLRQNALKYRQGRPYLDITEQYVYYGGKMHHDTPKTEAGVRWLPITEGLEAALKAHVLKLDDIRIKNKRWQENNLMFPSYHGTILGPRNIYRTRDQLVETLGLPHATLHEMRKAACSYLTRELIRQGRYSPKLVQRFLGHSRPDVALSTYTLVVEDDYSLAVFDPRLPVPADF